MGTTNKILVVGASIAGPATCYWLKRFGFEPTLIERSAAVRPGGYAIDIRGIAVDIAKKMGVYNSLCDHRTTINKSSAIDANGKMLAEEESEAAGFRQGEDVEILRGDLVNILMQQIPDIPCLFSTQVTKLVQHDNGVTVSLNDDTTQAFDMVIGADGLHSSIRDHAFSDVILHDLDAYISIFHIPNFLNLSRCELTFERNQKLIHMNSDKDPNIALLGLMLRSKHKLNKIEDKSIQKSFLRTNFKDLGWEANKVLELIDNCQDWYFDSITQVKMTNWTNGRVALVGDAGYCASPLSGQGTSLALIGAYILSGELHKNQHNIEEAFKQYNKIMRPLVDVTQAFGAWVSESYLKEGDMTSEATEQRNMAILTRMNKVANAIELPAY